MLKCFGFTFLLIHLLFLILLSSPSPCLSTTNPSVDTTTSTTISTTFTTSHDNQTTLLPSKKEAYVTLLYGDYYVLPVRVMMQSLLQNSPDVRSGLRDRLVIITGATSEASIQQLQSDGIITRRVPALESPYTKNPKFDARFTYVITKLKIFGLTEYRGLVFIDADTLIKGDMSSLFSCGHFCAAFINPCYFNSGLMKITPDRRLYKRMRKMLPVLKSYSGGDQGFLNNFYGDMLDSRSFNVSRIENGEVGREEWKKGGMKEIRRLPFGWHVDHSSYFPRFEFDYSKRRCGRQRVLGYLGPKFTKPWLWWTYAVLDLSWEWHRHRKLLKDPYPPGLANSKTALKGMVLCWVLGFIVVRVAPWFIELALRYNDWIPALGANVNLDMDDGVQNLKSWIYSFSVSWPTVTIGKRTHLMFAIILGVIGWLGSLLISVYLIPVLLTPYYAVALYIHTKTLTMMIILILLGITVSNTVGYKTKADAMRHHSTGTREADFKKLLTECMMWAVADGVFVPTGLKVLWVVPFVTVWQKICYALLALAIYMGFVVVMPARLSLRWIRATAYWSKPAYP